MNFKMTSKQIKKIIWSRDNKRCVYCNKTLYFTDATIDHYIPKYKKGGDSLYNLVTACSDCNVDKGHMLPLNFIAYKLKILTKTQAYTTRRVRNPSWVYPRDFTGRIPCCMMLAYWQAFYSMLKKDRLTANFFLERCLSLIREHPKFISPVTKEPIGKFVTYFRTCLDLKSVPEVMKWADQNQTPRKFQN